MTWKREPLTEDELEELISAAEDRGRKFEFTIRMLAHTGFRADTFAHMTSDWMSWQDKLVRVPIHEPCDCSGCRTKAKDSKTRGSGDYWRPKSDSGARTIPIRDPDTIRIARDFFSYHSEVGVSRQAISKRVKSVAENTELRKKVTPHVLRHTYGTMIAANGASPQYIRQTMGHSDLSSANTYLQYSGSQLNEEADEIWG